MINEMPCGYWTLWTTGVRIWHQVSRRACVKVSAGLNVSRRPAMRSQQLQTLTILNDESHSILNTPPSLQVLSRASENAFAESGSSLQRSMGGLSVWKYLEVLVRATSVSGRFAFGFSTEFHLADVAASMSSVSVGRHWQLQHYFSTIGQCMAIWHLQYMSEFPFAERDISANVHQRTCRVFRIWWRLCIKRHTAPRREKWKCTPHCTSYTESGTTFSSSWPSSSYEVVANLVFCESYGYFPHVCRNGQ